MRKLFVGLLIIIASSSPSVRSSPQDADKVAIDRFIAKQAKQQAGEEYETARQMATGDLNHDGVADVAVLYTIEGQNGTNNYVQYLAAFVRSKRGLVLMAHTVAGGKSNRGVALKFIKNNVIYCDTFAYHVNGPAGPSRASRARFKLSRHSLKEL